MKTTLPYQQQTKRPCEVSSQNYIQSHALSLAITGCIQFRQWQ